ncbi:hypothetical protein [Rhizobium sp. NRK18]|uniref:hypothetical protein n=1 Tax=Rhizobium sp. NRK18 TaxID=2964667 RepID=UPI0021C33A7E|nr:hypothetical protein [Rhizobium sp. NRK18]MCQ2005468.1 hypothetical protein [Rhizobium sp. NRK18]
MTGLDAAIRNALERANRSDPRVRAKIYQSARRALESGLEKQGIDDPVTIAAQRGRLERVIAAIEQEEELRLPPEPEEFDEPEPEETYPEAAPEPEPRHHAPLPQQQKPAPASVYPEPDLTHDAPPAADAGWFDAPAVSTSASGPSSANGRRRAPPPAANDLSALGAADARPAGSDRPQLADMLDLPATPSAKPRRRRGLFSRIFMVSVVIAFIGIGLGWALEAGLLGGGAGDEAPQSPTPQVAAEDSDATDKPQTVGIQTGFSSEWIELFTPQNISVLNARQNATIDPVDTSTGPAIQMTSTSADDDGSVTVTIPPAILRAMAGKRSTIALTFQSSSETNVQVSVQCDFSTLGGCGRHRFTVSQEKTDTLFQVTFARSLTPNSPGKLIINPDLQAKGNGINLYAVRLLPGR